MEALLITIRGGEQAAQKEVKELLGRDSELLDGAVKVLVEKDEEWMKLVHVSQSALRILLLDELESWLTKEMTFCVRSNRIGDEKTFGEAIFKKGFKVDLDDPDITLYVYNGILGIDVSGDISKRSFRIFTHRQTLKGPAAFVLLQEAGFTGKEVLLDPFSRDGTIPLEAVHKALKRSVRHFDRSYPFMKLRERDYDAFFDTFEGKGEPHVFAVSRDIRDITACKKNAKIAGVEKDLSYSRQDIEWLDLKFQEGEVDILLSYPPNLTPKQWNEFFAFIFVFAKKVVLLVPPDFSHPKASIKKEKTLWLGKEEKKIVWLSSKSSAR